MSDVSEVLNRAADILERPGAWTQGESAKSATGRSVLPNSKKAVCWCAVGAIYKATGLRGGLRNPLGLKAIFEFEGKLPSLVTDWNDAPERTQSEVVAKLREAAANV